MKWLVVVMLCTMDCTAFLSPQRMRAPCHLPAALNFDFDVIVVGCGVGGHAAALHAHSQGLKTCVFTGGDVGGTCVNRGCVPSKALLAASGRVREMKDTEHLKSLGLSTHGVSFDRQAVADHAKNLANRIQGNLEQSLKGLGIKVIEAKGVLSSPHTILAQGTEKKFTAKNLILAPGSVPFIPPGIVCDEKTVFSSNGGLNLEFIPDWVAIIGMGYIGLEFSDVYTSLGSEVTFIGAHPTLLPGFDRDIAKLAERLLIKPRAIDFRTGVRASEVTPGIPGVKPVTIKMVDARTNEQVETLEVDACLVATGRRPNTEGLGLDAVGVETVQGAVQVDEYMCVLTKPETDGGEVVPGLWCVGDANGKRMLAHAASAQGISAVENIVGRRYVVNHNAVPAACFTHPEIAFVGLTEEQALAKAAQDKGFTLGKSVGHFKANAKALAEGKGEGLVKVLFNKQSGKVVGAHILGLHAAELIQECANAVAVGTTIKELSFMVRTHPTLSEVAGSAFKDAAGMAA